MNRRRPSDVVAFVLGVITCVLTEATIWVAPGAELSGRLGATAGLTGIVGLFLWIRP